MAGSIWKKYIAERKKKKRKVPHMLYPALHKEKKRRRVSFGAWLIARDGRRGKGRKERNGRVPAFINIFTCFLFYYYEKEEGNKEKREEF